jgi:hypothetical protein
LWHAGSGWAPEELAKLRVVVECMSTTISAFVKQRKSAEATLEDTRGVLANTLAEVRG